MLHLPWSHVLRSGEKWNGWVHGGKIDGLETNWLVESTAIDSSK